ncbi:MAG TPA: ArsI/CadI family heavy metal resistance metalloenzyme [Acidimicrobiales bacterium]|jgi:catechol 2,3-dioxygenase-like lactoylglutathione lyase family enzyme|nr:ArsI/CadI family heavy metal resistance metalloenzyme [Acidimicrobiales bacterium]
MSVNATSHRRPTSRVQLALSVSDLQASVDFYRKLLRAEPAKRRDGYANFAVADPPLKLVLIEDPRVRGRGGAGVLNHLGIEVSGRDEVARATRRLSDEGLAVVTEQAATCCHAVQDKVWVADPDGTPWEVYTVLADARMGGAGDTSSCRAPAVACCASDSPGT